jgi:hypothetical protein
MKKQRTTFNQQQDDFLLDTINNDVSTSMLLWNINNGLSISMHNAQYYMGSYALQDMHTLDWDYAVYDGYATAAKNIVKLLKKLKTIK